MNNYINPFTLIKETYLEAQTVSEKFLAVFFGLWVSLLGSLAIVGSIYVLFQLITNPTQFNNATWGIFDTLG